MCVGIRNGTVSNREDTQREGRNQTQGCPRQSTGGCTSTEVREDLQIKNENREMSLYKSGCLDQAKLAEMAR